MTLRTLLLASALGAALSSCGPAAVKCQPSNCSGCCSEAGECLGPQKQSAQACGNSGATCRVCLPDQLCVSSRCVRNPDAGVPVDDAGMDPIDSGTPDAGPQCGASGQACCSGACNLGLTCNRGVCQTPTDSGVICGGSGEACCNGTTCLAPYTCLSNVCQLPPPDSGMAKATGEPCQVNTECLDGLCQVFGFPNGYCTRACTTSGDCLAGTQCGRNPSGSPAKVCLKQCSSPGQAPGGCRTSYVCEKNADTASVPVCYPGCTSNTMCGTAPTCDGRGFCCGNSGAACCGGTMCEAGNQCTNGYCQSSACGNSGQACCTSGAQCVTGYACVSNTCTACGALNQPCCAGNTCNSGTCQAGTCQTATLKPIADPCSAGTECTGGTCITASGAYWSGGYCTQDCSSTACPSGTSGCSQGLVISGSSLCFKFCQWDGGAGGCRSGYVCDKGVITGTPNQGACISACTGTQDCPGSLPCQGGFCCGARGFRCCAGNTCPSGGSCSAGYCQ